MLPATGSCTPWPPGAGRKFSLCFQEGVGQTPKSFNIGAVKALRLHAHSHASAKKFTDIHSYDQTVGGGETHSHPARDFEHRASLPPEKRTARVSAAVTNGNDESQDGGEGARGGSLAREYLACCARVQFRRWGESTVGRYLAVDQSVDGCRVKLRCCLGF
jgi:hypothetical protein